MTQPRFRIELSNGTLAYGIWDDQKAREIARFDFRDEAEAYCDWRNEKQATEEEEEEGK